MKRPTQTSASPVLSSLLNLDAPSGDNQLICAIVARNFHIQGQHSIRKGRQ